jgi:hypothetical protein
VGNQKIHQFLTHLGHIELQRVDDERIQKSRLNRVGYSLAAVMSVSGGFTYHAQAFSSASGESR